MRYTRSADAAIRTELLEVEVEMRCAPLRNEVMRWRAFCYGALFVAGVLVVAILGFLNSIGGRQ